MAKARPVGEGDDLVRLYLDDIGRHPLLTKEDEVRLARQIEDGNAARELLTSDGAGHGRQRRTRPPTGVRPDEPIRPGAGSGYSWCEHAFVIRCGIGPHIRAP